MLAAAWLHDVVEDTKFTIFDIQLFFGEEIALYVSDLTEPFVGSRSARKPYYKHQLATACPVVQTIKYADLISNTSSIVERDPDFAKVYLKETRELLEVMDNGHQGLYEMARRLAYNPLGVGE
jgi:(p)ppGpp synthase/HD superfamily hydrolase